MKIISIIVLSLLFLFFALRWRWYQNFPSEKFQINSKKEAISGVLSFFSFFAYIVTDYFLFGLIGVFSLILHLFFSFKSGYELFIKPINSDTAKWHVDRTYNEDYVQCPHCQKSEIRKNIFFKKCPECKKFFNI